MLIPLDSDVNDIIQPLSYFRAYNRLECNGVDLRGYQTPTLEYLRARTTSRV